MFVILTSVNVTYSVR